MKGEVQVITHADRDAFSNNGNEGEGRKQCVGVDLLVVRLFHGMDLAIQVSDENRSALCQRKQSERRTIV